MAHTILGGLLIFQAWWDGRWLLTDHQSYPTWGWGLAERSTHRGTYLWKVHCRLLKSFSSLDVLSWWNYLMTNSTKWPKLCSLSSFIHLFSQHCNKQQIKLNRPKPKMDIQLVLKLEDDCHTQIQVAYYPHPKWLVIVTAQQQPQPKQQNNQNCSWIETK